MAITIVGGETALKRDTYPNLAGGIIINYPPGITAGDVLHLMVGLPIYRQWYLEHVMKLWVQYGIGVPAGWQLVGTEAFNAHLGHESAGSQRFMALFRRVALGTETGQVFVPISETNYRGVPFTGEVTVAAALVAHSGAAISDPYESPPRFISGPWDSKNGLVTTLNSRLAWLDFAYGELPAPWPNPVPVVSGNPVEWTVVAQEALTSGGSTTHALVGDADTFSLGSFAGGFRNPRGANPSTSRVVFALRDAADSNVDTAPLPGQVGTTGSGSLTPEWQGRDRVIDNPLVASVWTEGVDEFNTPVLELLAEGEDFTQPVAADLTFNGLGACTSGTIAFPAAPGLVPFGHVVKLALALFGEPSAPVWFTGLVENTRFENGLHLVDVTGLWSILNDARVQLDGSGEVTDPAHPVITGVLRLGVGDPTTATPEDDQAAQQTWGEHLNNRFRVTPQAAWGIGPDQVFVMGLPEQGGVQILDAGSDPAVLTVTPSEFILPPFVTDWWAADGDGAVLTGTVFPPPGLLSPLRLTQSRLDEFGNLVMPPESQLPLVAGPTHVIEVAGIAIPPLQVLNLPSGEAQFVASARVQVTVGEEGSMPRVTTTLTTVALPFERGGT